MNRYLTASLAALALASCNAPSDAQPTGAKADGTADISGAARTSANKPFIETEVARFDEPWAMAFIPGTPYALITEKKGKLKLWEAGGAVVDVAGVPTVAYGGQGGFGDVVLGPSYKDDGMIYLSWVEAGDGGKGAVIGRARLNLDNPAAPKLDGLGIIWKQSPKVDGNGHFSHRIAFSPDGKYMFVGSGERQKFEPAQDMKQNLGKVLRLYPDGSVPADNPYAGQGSPTDQIWSLGHRNILGMAFDDNGNLWEIEMGPKGGDELDLVTRKANYGYPRVSNGSHYDGRDIPDHKPGDGFEAPKLWWNPAISPSSLMFYRGELFPDWERSLFVGALSGEALIRITLKDQKASKADQWDMGTRIREVEQGPDGAVWLLEDGSNGRLIKLTPKQEG